MAVVPYWTELTALATNAAPGEHSKRQGHASIACGLIVGIADIPPVLVKLPSHVIGNKAAVALVFDEKGFKCNFVTRTH